MKKYENIFLLGLICICTAIGLASRSAPSFGHETITAGQYGLVMGLLAAVVCAGKIAANIIFKEGTYNYGEKSEIKGQKLIAIQAVMMFLYAWGIIKVGYFTVTFVYLMVSLVILSDSKGWKNILKYFVFTTCFTVGLNFVFKIFNVFLPKTPLI